MSTNESNNPSAAKADNGNASSAPVSVNHPSGASAPLNSIPVHGPQAPVASAIGPAAVTATTAAPTAVPNAPIAAGAAPVPPATTETSKTPVNVAAVNVNVAAAAAAAAAVARIPTSQVPIAVTNAAVAAAGNLDISSIPAVLPPAALPSAAPKVAQVPAAATVVQNTNLAATVKAVGAGTGVAAGLTHQFQRAQAQAQAHAHPQQQQQQNGQTSAASPSWSVPNPLAMLGGNGSTPPPNATPAAVTSVAAPNVTATTAAAALQTNVNSNVMTTATNTVKTAATKSAASLTLQPNTNAHTKVITASTSASATSTAVPAQMQVVNYAIQVQPQQQHHVQTQAAVQPQRVAVAQPQAQMQIQPTPVAVPVPVAAAKPVQVQAQPHVQVQAQAQPGIVRPVTVSVGAAVAGTAPTTTVTTTAPNGQQVVRRKLVLTPEGRTALTKAVLSSLKDPNGIMDPTLLQQAMQITKLSEKAILNAAKMAKEREEQKKKRMGIGTSANVHVRNVNVNAAHGRGQVQAQRAPQQVIRSNTGVMVVSGGSVTHTGAVSTSAAPVPPQAHQGVVYHQTHTHPTAHQQVQVQHQHQYQHTHPHQQQHQHQTHVNVQSRAPVPPVQHMQHGAVPAQAKGISVPIPMPTPVVGVPYKPQLTPQQQQQQQQQQQMEQEKLHQQRLHQEKLRQQQLKQQQALKQEKLRQQQLQQQKIAQQKKEAQERARLRALEAAMIAKEMSQWSRIHHGVFTKNPVPSNGVSSSSKATSSRVFSLGAVSRCQNTTPALTDENSKTTVTEDMWRDIFAIQSQVKKSRNVEGIVPNEKIATPSSSSLTGTTSSSPPAKIANKPRRFEHAKIALSDITDKSKRLKLQPRKESRALEKNLRKHRQITCETLVKKHKDLNKQIMTHSSEFYKFHRTRKMEISKFARSVRDHVTMIQRKKEKGAVNEEKARITALKANDMQAYTQLVQETRNERLKFLLDKTDSYIHQISGLLQDQHADADGTKKKAEDSVENGGVEVVGNSSRLPIEEDEAASSYYQTAHVRQEEVKQPSTLVGGKLKEYQVSGLQWLVSLYNNKLNGILADEMGLGKTVQTIALIAYLMEVKDNRGPYLVVVPLSTLSNWVNEFVRWCPSATVIVYKGTPAQRKGLFKSEVRGGHFNVLLTTYEYIIKDKASLRKLQWEYAIVDEGHRMKNAQSKFAVTLGTAYVTKHRVLLTGTPLQNSLPELWALLNFLLPSVFNSVETFDQWFNKPFAQFGTAASDGDTEEVVNTEERLLIIQRLHELLRPFMLRRIKADVLDQLPDKVEKVLRCELSSWQKELYKQISYSVLADGQKKSKRGLNNVVMQLRKVCNHPYMFTPEGYYITEEIIRTSGKVELLDRMLPKLKAAGHRVLMFFQMTAAMTILEDYFKLRGILSLRLDGSTTGEERERRMDLFNAPNSPYFVFMLSTRAGGLGLNLVSADTVIIFDSDWNPMMDLQAQDRAHRIGQKKVVSVFRLITNSPVEEKILSRATEKLNMSEIIVEAGKFDKSGLKEDGAEERQKIMEVLLTDFNTGTGKSSGSTTGNLEEEDASGDEEKEEIDINELLSRNDEDFEFYSKMDTGEIKDPDFFDSPGLLTDPNDIPDWIKYPNKNEENDTSENGVLLDPSQRRAAAKKTAGYDDGLTEKQFLRIMEKQAKDEEDAAKARKLEWHEKRNKSAAAAAASLVESNGDHEVASTLSQAIFDRLVSMTKSIIAIRDKKTKRRHSDIFREQPSRDEYPDYFSIIEKPISINDIMKKCRGKIYTSVRQYHSDFMLMFANAKKFNGDTSWIANDANVLEAELNRLLNKYKIMEEEPKKEEAPPPKKKKPRIKLSLKKLSAKRKKGNGTASTPKTKRQRTG